MTIAVDWDVKHCFKQTNKQTNKSNAHMFLNYSNSLRLHVAESIGSLRRLKKPKPRYGPSPFSLICSLHF